MAKTNEEILEALLGLSPGNDEHWTADGLPRLDAVENLLGASVTRKQLTNAAPDFNRAMAQSVVDEAASQGDAEPSGADKTEPNADPQSPEDLGETDTATADAGGLDDFDPLAEGPGDEEAAMDEAVQRAQARVTALERTIQDSRVELSKAEQALSRAINARSAAFPPMSAAAAIQQFQRSELEKRAAAAAVVKEWATDRVSSPIDEALKARNAHQGRRTPDLSSSKG